MHAAMAAARWAPRRHAAAQGRRIAGEGIMRRPSAIAWLAATLTGCNVLGGGLGGESGSLEGDAAPGIGAWEVGAAPALFPGAVAVRLAMQPGAFTLTAAYDGRPPVTIDGTTRPFGNGLLSLTPTRVRGAAAGSHAFVLSPMIAATNGDALTLMPDQTMAMLGAMQQEFLVFRRPGAAPPDAPLAPPTAKDAPGAPEPDAPSCACAAVVPEHEATKR
jgi:hypothetical protein